MRSIIQLSIAILASSGALSPPCAQATRWITYTLADGLPALDVLDLVQAQDGRTWVATPGGLARIDRRVPAARWESVSPEFFRFLAVDTRGVVWAAGDDGRLQWFDASGAVITTPSLLSPGASVTALYASPDGSVWLGEWNPQQGIKRLGRWREAEETQWWLALNGPIWDIDGAPSGRIWVGLDNGFGRFTGNGIFTVLTPDPSDQATSAILALSDDEAILGTSHGNAYYYSFATFRFSAEVFGDNESQPVENITRDAFGLLWLARQEAYRFDTKSSPSTPQTWTKTVFDSNTGLNADVVNLIFESTPFQGTAMTPIGTRELWFGTDLGVSVLTAFPWTTYSTSFGALVCSEAITEGNCNSVGHIVVDPHRDAVWFGALFGLSRRNADGSWDAWTNGSLPGTPPGLTHNTVFALHLDDDGRLWVSTGDLDVPLALQYQDPGTSNWVPVGNDDPRWRVADLARDANRMLWLAAADGAWRLDTSTDPFGETHFGTAEGVPAGPLQALATDANDVFVASEAGIGHFEQATGSWTAWPITALPGPGPWIFRELLVLQDTLYAATDHGLVVVPSSATSLAEATVLSAASDIRGGFATDLYSVADGGNGTMLVGAETGLYRLSADRRAAGRMDTRDGLPEANVICVTTYGDETWIGTKGDGAAGHVFEPPETAIVRPPGPVVVSSTNPALVVVDAADLDSPLDLMQFELRIDEGAWGVPQTGPNITFVPATLGLADGTHVVHVRAVDSGLLYDATPATAPFELDTSPPIARVTSPVEGAAVRGTVQIVGTADDVEDQRFDSYFVGARPRNDAALPLIEIQPWTNTPVVNAVIANWNTTQLSDDWYTLEVIVRDQLGVNGTLKVDVLVDNAPPFADVTSPQQVRGDRGATVYSVAGEARIVIPPFAFDGEQVITVDRVPDPETAAGEAFLLGPSGLRLRKDPTLELRATDQHEPLSIHRRNDTVWVPIGGTPEHRADGVYYAASIDRLGLYALRAPAAAVPGGVTISQLRAEPRHFNPRTSGLGQIAVSFVLGKPATVTALVYSRAGRPRRVLVEDRVLQAGEQVLYWDGRDDDGNLVASALYIVCVEAAGERVTKVVTVGAE